VNINLAWRALEHEISCAGAVKLPRFHDLSNNVSQSGPYGPRMRDLTIGLFTTRANLFNWRVGMTADG
jgi:hypothetical protein